MNDWYSLLMLLGLGALVGVWLKLSTTREYASREARRQCQQHGLQLLDETVGLSGIRLRRVNGRYAIECSYRFEVSIDGDDREPGLLGMIGNTLNSLSLPTIRLIPGEATPPTKASTESNVVPFRPRDRADHHLN